MLPGSGTGRGGRERQLKVAYQVSKTRPAMSPPYTPKTVSTDSWKGTQAAWKMLLRRSSPAVLLARLAQDTRPSQTPKEVFAKSPGGFGIPITRPIAGVLHNAPALPVGGRTTHRDRPGEGRTVWQPMVIAYRHPEVTAQQHARPTDARHEPLLRSGPTPARLGGLPALSCRALLCNFTPWHPAVAGENQGWRCPAERLNQSIPYCWLQI